MLNTSMKTPKVHLHPGDALPGSNLSKMPIPVTQLDRLVILLRPEEDPAFTLQSPSCKVPIPSWGFALGSSLLLSFSLPISKLANDSLLVGPPDLQPVISMCRIQHCKQIILAQMKCLSGIVFFGHLPIVSPFFIHSSLVSAVTQI